jgi:hypothetical protein
MRKTLIEYNRNQKYKIVKGANMRTGMSQGPRGLRDVSKINEPLNLDFSLEESVRKSILAATWLDDVDLGAAKEAVMLAETMDQFPDRRHQIAPILIGLLSNLGLLNNRKTTEMSPADMLAAIANG